MKKNIIIVTLCIIVAFSAKAQSLDSLMNGYDNKYALEHLELYTKFENRIQANYDIPFHRSIKIVNVDAIWLDNITTLIEENPTIMYPYLDSSTQNLAAYILLSHVFSIDMPETEGVGDSSKKEVVLINFLKNHISEEIIEIYAERNIIPSGQDLFEHLMNKLWGEIAIANGVNTRLKTAISNR